MQLRLLGTGSPNPLPERQGAAVLLSCEHEHLLFDAGRGVTTQLVRSGVFPQALNAIFITHHNYDHIGNLGDLLLTAWGLHASANHRPARNGSDRPGTVRSGLPARDCLLACARTGNCSQPARYSCNNANHDYDQRANLPIWRMAHHCRCC